MRRLCFGLLPFFYRWGDWCSERVRVLPKAMHLGLKADPVRLQTQDLSHSAELLPRPWSLLDFFPIWKFFSTRALWWCSRPSSSHVERWYPKSRKCVNVGTCLPSEPTMKKQLWLDLTCGNVWRIPTVGVGTADWVGCCPIQLGAFAAGTMT